MPQDNPMAYFDAGQKLGEGLGGSIGGTGGAQSRSFVRALALKKAGQEFQINKMAADLGIMTEYNNNTGKWDINPQFKDADPTLLRISIEKANDRKWKVWTETQKLKQGAYGQINNAATRYDKSNGRDKFALDEIRSNAAAAGWDEKYTEQYIQTLNDKESHEEFLHNTWNEVNLAYQKNPGNMDLKSHVMALWGSRDYAKFRKDTQFTNPFTDELNKMQTRNKGVEQLRIEEEKKKEADALRAQRFKIAEENRGLERKIGEEQRAESRAIDQAVEIDTGKRKQKVSELMKLNPSMTEDIAHAIVTGKRTSVTNPLLGTTSIVDVTKGTQSPLQETRQEEKPLDINKLETDESGKIITSPKEKTAWGYSGLGTGVWSALRAGGSVITGTLGGSVAVETLKARQMLKSSSFSLITSMQNSPRFNEGERKALADAIGLEPSVWKPPLVWRQEAKAIDDYLERKLTSEKRASKDTMLPVSERKMALRAVKLITDYRKLLGVPPTFSSPNDAGFKALPSGSQFFTPNGEIRWKK
ncbi:MAG: hypothetical protein KKC77_19180 [Proteobacteria bacterium]|nr:hypothetical protein [Pseudomonadota bacterium]